MKQYLVILLLFIAFKGFGQYTITGRVINKTDKSAVANAAVFLNNTIIECATDKDGGFTLKNVPAGQYQLLITIVGYESFKIPVIVNGSVSLTGIELTPKDEVLKDVVVKAKPGMSPCYPAFVTEFLGTTPFARQCKILNPYDIQFNDIDPQGGFTARSNNFIEIENNALGYKIKFLLNYFIRDIKTNHTYFGGQSYFEEMKGTPSEEQEWKKHRLECYQGSVIQLLRAIIADSIKENGYRIKRAHREVNPYFNPNGFEVDPYNIDNSIGFFGDADNLKYNDKITDGVLHKKDLLLTTSDKGLLAISGNVNNNNSLFIEHVADIVSPPGKPPVHVRWIWRSTVSIITFDKPYVIFDHNGKIFNPRSINYAGFFTEQTRMATQLPFDYKPM